MKHICTLLFFCLASGLQGQSLELSGGLSMNSFYHTNQNRGSLQTNYTSGTGYSLGLTAEFDLHGFVEKPLPLKLRLGLSTYAGSFTISDGGRSYQNSTDAEVEKTSLDLAFYPLNISLVDRLSVSAGLEFNFLLKDNSAAIASSWQQCVCPSGIESKKGPKEISKGNTARFSSMFAYALKLSKGLYVVPQYQFSLGLTNEFEGLQTNTKAMRHACWIGIRKDL